jgi:hypothetical protein
LFLGNIPIEVSVLKRSFVQHALTGLCREFGRN